MLSKNHPKDFILALHEVICNFIVILINYRVISNPISYTDIEDIVFQQAFYFCSIFHFLKGCDIQELISLILDSSLKNTAGIDNEV